MKLSFLSEQKRPEETAEHLCHRGIDYEKRRGEQGRERKNECGELVLQRWVAHPYYRYSHPHRVMHSVIRYRENHIARPRKYNTACHMHPFFVRENPYKQKTESRNTINDLHGFASMQCYI